MPCQPSEFELASLSRAGSLLHVKSSRAGSLLQVPGVLAAALLSSPLAADTVPGWMVNEHVDAYTLDRMALDLSIGGAAVNDTIDVLNYREDLLAGNRRLEGDSGDLSATNAELQFGVASMLSVFYRQQNQDMSIELGNIRSINLLSLDDELQTTSTAYGFKWNIYEAGRNGGDRPWHAMSLEVSRIENDTDDFSGTLDRVQLNNNTNVTFLQPQTFSVTRMEDEGWRARLIYSLPLGPALTSSIWAGYSQSDATSGTTSDLAAPSLRDAFEQTFKVEEDRAHVGVGLNWQITPRMPLQVSYEYTSINSDTTIISNPLNVLLPSFLRATNLNSVDADANHQLHGTLSYWITPRVSVSVSGKLFSNQFMGIIPHYTNPLSGSFADEPYGYAGIEIGVRL